MGYDLGLQDAKTGKVITVDKKHQVKGSTYAVGGSVALELSVTYNYATYYYDVLDRNKGLRVLYGMKAGESVDKLNDGITALDEYEDEDIDGADNYWLSTAANARRALVDLRTLAMMAPSDAMWMGD